jgi:hypothetical protein
MSFNFFDILMFKIKKLFADEVAVESFDEFVKFVRHEECTAVYGKVEVERRIVRIRSRNREAAFCYATLFFHSKRGQIIAFKDFINQETSVIERGPNNSIVVSDLLNLMAFSKMSSYMKKLNKLFPKKLKTGFLDPKGKLMDKDQRESLKAQVRNYGFEMD